MCHAAASAYVVANCPASNLSEYGKYLPAVMPTTIAHGGQPPSEPKCQARRE
jgi:hypothetical protein